MSIEALKEELNTLTASELQSVLAHVVSLRGQMQDDHIDRMTAILDNKEPSFWVPFEQCEERWAKEDTEDEVSK